MDDVSLVAGPLHLFALVLAVSGAHKLLEPAAAAQAMVIAGVPKQFASGRTVGAAEVVAGAAALAFGGPIAAAAVGVLYAAFAGFLLVLRRRDADAPCGCFGASDAPPGVVHLVLNIGASAVVVAALATGTPSIVDVAEVAPLTHLGAYGALLFAGTLAIIVGTAVTEDIRRWTDLMRA